MRDASLMRLTSSEFEAVYMFFEGRVQICVKWYMGWSYVTQNCKTAFVKLSMTSTKSSTALKLISH